MWYIGYIGFIFDMTPTPPPSDLSSPISSIYSLFCEFCNFIFNLYIHAVIYIQDNTTCLRNFRDHIICIRSEPDQSKWVSVSCILANNKEYNMFYYDDPNSVFFRWFIYSNYNDNYEWFEDYVPREQLDKTLPVNEYYRSRLILTQNEPVHSPVVIVNQDKELQVVKLITPSINLCEIDNSILLKSKVSFLCILYAHPKMKNEITLKLPHSCYYVGNQILSAAYVYRLLEYTVGYMFYFDMSYKVKIIDASMKYTELSSNEYIELEHCGYVKKTI